MFDYVFLFFCVLLISRYSPLSRSRRHYQDNYYRLPDSNRRFLDYSLTPMTSASEMTQYACPREGCGAQGLSEDALWTHEAREHGRLRRSALTCPICTTVVSPYVEAPL